MAHYTRSGSLSDPIIGICNEFHANQLPTDLDVLKKLLSLRKSVVKSEPKHEHLKETAKSVEDIWLKTNIPIIHISSIIRKVKKIYESYRKVYKIAKYSDENAKLFRDKIQQSLFDIAVCKCSDACTCAYKFKIPLNGRELLNDQRTTRASQLPDTRIKKRQYQPQSGTTSPKPKRKQTKIDVPQPRRLLEREKEPTTSIEKPKRVQLLPEKPKRCPRITAVRCFNARSCINFKCIQKRRWRHKRKKCNRPK